MRSNPAGEVIDAPVTPGEDISADNRRGWRESHRAGPAGPAGPRRRLVLTSLIAAVGIIALAAIGVFAMLGGRLDAEIAGPEQDGTLVAVGDAGRILTASGSGEVALIDDGQLAKSTSVDRGEVLSLALSGEIGVAGTSDGTVAAFNNSLEKVAEAAFDGRVVAATSINGGFAVAYGYGQYASSFAIAVLGPDLTVEQSWSVAGTATALAGRPDGGLFVGGSSGQLFVMDSRGDTVCTAFVDSTVTALAAARTGVLVGDAGGVVSLIEDDCTVAWSISSSTHEVRAITEATGRVVMGDSVGNIAIVADGETQLSARIELSAIRALMADGALVTVVPADGNIVRIDIARAGEPFPLWLGLLLAGVVVGSAVWTVIRTLRHHQRALTTAGRIARRVWRNRLGYLFVLPALALIGVFFYYPVADAVRVSFTNTDLSTGTSEWIGLANYVTVITDDPYFHRGLLNLLVFLAAAILKTFTVPLACALLVFWLRSSRQRSIYRILLVLPVVVPDLVTTLLWKTIYQPDGGLLNATLEAIGLGDLQRVWLGDENTALFAVLFVGFPFMNAFAFLIFYGGLLQIDPSVFEAASLDGVGPWRRLVSIELPLLRPQAGILILFATIGAIQGIASVFVLTRGGPNLATYVPALEMYDNIGQGAIAYASTIGIVLALSILLLTTIARWRPRRASRGRDR